MGAQCPEGRGRGSSEEDDDASTVTSGDFSVLMASTALYRQMDK